MTSTSFQTGEVVRLRSGGPSMTIKSFELQDSTPLDQRQTLPPNFVGNVRCIWHEQGGKLLEAIFPVHVLQGQQSNNRWHLQQSGYQQNQSNQLYGQGNGGREYDQQRAIQEASSMR